MSEIHIRDLGEDKAEVKVDGKGIELINLIGSAMLADDKLLELVRQALVLVDYMNKENTNDKRTVN
mgnify:FL=1